MLFLSYNHFKKDSEEYNKHIEFIRWMKNHKSNLYKTRIEIYEKNYRGIHATVNIEKYQEIISVPIEMAISYKTMENTELGKKLVEAKIFDAKWEVYLFPLIFVLEEHKNPNSTYRKYIDILPKTAENHPAFYGPDELNLLKGSTLLEQLEIDKSLIKSFYDDICLKCDPTFSNRHSFSEFMSIYYILCSRFFGIAAYDSRLAFLVPYADLANTGGLENRNASWDYNEKNHSFRLYATRKIKKGEPVFLFSVGKSVDFIALRTSVEFCIYALLWNVFRR